MDQNSLGMEFHQRLLLDGDKLQWHKDRVDALLRGEKVAPVTVDMALTDTCNLACKFCYATLQSNQGFKITEDIMRRFIDDAAEIGVRGISLVSDGESTLNPCYEFTIKYGASKGISMASGSNAIALDENRIRNILPHLDYFRVNITAGTEDRFNAIMGAKAGHFKKVLANIATMVRVKKELSLECTIGMQMVLMPEFEDDVLPLAELAVELGADYLVIKHCSDDEDGALGVNYSGYEKFYDKLRIAEAMSTKQTSIQVKWSKIGDKGTREYSKCYGPSLLLQMSGTGLVAPCGMLFGSQYKKLHIGNICKDSFKDMVMGDRYQEVMRYLASDDFNAKVQCGSLCLQHRINTKLDRIVKGQLTLPDISKQDPPHHINFI